MQRQSSSNMEHEYIYRLFRYICLAVLIAFGLIAVIATGNGGGTDNDDNSGDDNNQVEYDSCEETVRTLADINEVGTLLDISAADVLGEAGDGFTTTAFYSDDTSTLTQSPLGGETDLTVTVSYEGGEIREIESQPIEGNGDGAAPDIAVICRHRLEVEVMVDFSTSDGAFTERWQALLVKSVNAEDDGFDDTSLTAEFDPADIEGSFEIISISGQEPDSVDGRLSTSTISPYSGDIDILVQQTNGNGEDATVSLTSHVALSWGENR